MEAVPPNPELACDALAQARTALDRLTAVIDRAMQTGNPDDDMAEIVYAGRVAHDMERTIAAHEVKAEALTAAMKAHGDLRYEQGREDERQATREDRGQESALRLVSGDSPPRIPHPRVHRVRILSVLAPAAAIVAAVAAGPAHHAHFTARAGHAHTAATVVPDYDELYVPLRP